MVGVLGPVVIYQLVENYRPWDIYCTGCSICNTGPHVTRVADAAEAPQLPSLQHVVQHERGPPYKGGSPVLYVLQRSGVLRVLCCIGIFTTKECSKWLAEISMDPG